ncbi:MAG: hypothetical protein QF752_03340 [Planctomycetota bacterium]|nr:hypothetical protein [Planctomycetota bacterium]
MRAPLSLALYAFLAMSVSVLILVGWNWFLVGGSGQSSEKYPVQFRVQVEGPQGEGIWVPMGTQPPRTPARGVERRWRLEGLLSTEKKKP